MGNGLSKRAKRRNRVRDEKLELQNTVEVLGKAFEVYRAEFKDLKRISIRNSGAVELTNRLPKDFLDHVSKYAEREFGRHVFEALGTQNPDLMPVARQAAEFIAADFMRNRFSFGSVAAEGTFDEFAEDANLKVSFYLRNIQTHQMIPKVLIDDYNAPFRGIIPHRKSGELMMLGAPL